MGRRRTAIDIEQVRACNLLVGDVVMTHPDGVLVLGVWKSGDTPLDQLIATTVSEMDDRYVLVKLESDRADLYVDYAANGGTYFHRHNTQKKGHPDRHSRLVIWPKYHLVSTQITRNIWSDAPRYVSVELPEGDLVDDDVDVSWGTAMPLEGIDAGQVEATIYRSEIDGAVVVEVDTPFEPDGSDGQGLRINLNDGLIWKDGLSLNHD